MLEDFDQRRDAGDAALNGKMIRIPDQVHAIADKPVQPDDMIRSVFQYAAVLPSPSTDIESQTGRNAQHTCLREKFGQLAAGIVPASPGHAILHALETTLDS
jgi:hypothetical protein